MYHVENDSIHTEYICQYTPNTYQYVLVCIEYIPIPPLRIGVCIETCIVVCICLNPSTKHAIRTLYCQNTCLILTNTDWYVSIHTRHVSIHTYNTYRNTYQNTYQYGAVVLVRICTYQVSIRALHFPDELGSTLLLPGKRRSSTGRFQATVLLHQDV